MSLKFRSLFAFALLLGATFTASTASADPWSRVPAATPTPTPTPEPVSPIGYEVGVLGNVMTVDPILGSFYTQHQNVDGETLGIFLTRRGLNGFRLTYEVTYTGVSPKDGPWLESGKQPPSTQWTEFKSFSVITADVIAGHEWEGNGTFGFYVGGGIGLAIPLGSINKYNALGTNYGQASNYDFTNDDKQSIPPVVPNVIFKAGPTVNIVNKAKLGIDVGLQDGLFVGLTLAYGL